MLVKKTLYKIQIKKITVYENRKKIIKNINKD